MPKKYLFPKILFILIFSWSIILLFYFSLYATPFSLWQNIMWVSGLLSVLFMTRQVILWIRAVSSSRIKDFFRVNRRHKWLGIGTLIAVLLHPIWIVITYMANRAYAILPDFSSSFETRVTIGKFCLLLLLIVLLTSILSRKLLRYRTRYWIHLLTYLVVIAGWFHGRVAGTKINTIPAVHTYWIILWSIIWLISIARLFQAIWFFQKHAIIVSHTQLTNDVYEIQAQLSKWVQYSHGQFVYLQYKKFGEAHPFTIVTYNKETKIITIAYKIIGKFTQELSKLHPQEKIFLDGPYGTFLWDTLQHRTPIVCIAWWIGITPFYHLLKHNNLSNIKLIYLNKTFEEGVYIKNIDEALTNRVTHIFSREEILKESIKNLQGCVIIRQRMDKTILQKNIWDDLQNAHYYICGSESVIRGTKELLLSLHINSKNIHREPFEM